MKKKLALYL